MPPETDNDTVKPLVGYKCVGAVAEQRIRHLKLRQDPEELNGGLRRFGLTEQAAGTADTEGGHIGKRRILRKAKAANVFQGAKQSHHPFSLLSFYYNKYFLKIE